MTTLLPGTQVRARGLAWEVVHAEQASAQQRYRLRCTEGGLRGQEIDILAPFAVVRPDVRELDPTRAGRLRGWRLYHHAFRMGAAGEREDNITRKLAEVVARRADGLLLLTAPPHDGHDPHFASLVELLDPSLVDGRDSLRGDAYRRHVIHRLKQHVKDPKTGVPLFRERRVHPRPVVLDPASAPRVAEFQQGLVELVVPRLRSAVRRRRYEDVLAIVALLKRSVSSLRAAGSMLRARLPGTTEQGTGSRDRSGQTSFLPPDFGPHLDRAQPIAEGAAAAARLGRRGQDDGGANESVYATLAHHLDERGVLTSRDAQGTTGLPAASVRPLLQHLVEEGRAVQEGQRRGTRYRRVRS